MSEPDSRSPYTPSRSTTRWARTATPSCSCPARTGRRGPAAGQGRLLHRDRGPRRLPDRRHHPRQGGGLQPLPGRRRHRQLHRPQQLLAHPVQPVDRHRRGRSGRLPHGGQFLGRLAGRLHASAEHHRRHLVADGLLHRRPAVRQRRLHRRLQTARRHQWLPAAVADPQQRGRRLVQRGLEPGLLGHGRRTARSRLPQPALHHAGPDTGQPREALPVRRRPGPVGGPGAVRAAEQPRHHLGLGSDARSHHRAQRVLRGQAG